MTRKCLPPLARAALLLATACGGAPHAVARPAPGQPGVYIVGCEQSPMRCLEEAERVCPHGHETLKAGEGAWYADGEDFRHTEPVLRRRPHYRQEGWVVRCNPPAGI